MEIKVSELKIQNFRAIKNSRIHLDKQTVLIGKNNIGKTTLFEAFDSFDRGLKLSDINMNLLIRLMQNRQSPENLTNSDCVELSVIYDWSDLSADYWSLLSSVADKGKTKIVVQYSIPEENYPKYRDVESVKELTELLSRKLWIGSPEDYKADRQVSLPSMVRLQKYFPLPRSLDRLQSGDILLCPIAAFRYLSSGKTGSEQATESQFSESVARILGESDDVKKTFSMAQKDIDEVVSDKLEPFQERLKDFAYPRDPKNPLRAILTIDEWLASPKVRIAQSFGELAGFELPLNAQGLGYQNIYNILARISAQFAKMDSLELQNPMFFVIEEPEAFTHPQLQHMFVQQIRDFISAEADKLGLSFQLLIISHSSEVAVSAFESDFEIVVGRRRGDTSYFINWDSIGGTDSQSRDKLKKLLLNYNAEILFADKLIAYEGNAERLILTALMRKNVPSLLSEKVAFIPVGTAFTGLYNALADLRFEKILLITDLDYKSLPHSNDPLNEDGLSTTNGNLRYICSSLPSRLNDIDFSNFFKEKSASITNNFSLTPTSGVFSDPDGENAMIVTQGYNKQFAFWPRTLESALVFDSLKNFTAYKKAGLLRAKIDQTSKQNINDVNNIYGNLLKVGKADFALESLNLISSDEFTVPEYIMKGLKWLAEVDE